MSGHRKWSAIRVPNDDRERQALIEQEARLTDVLLSLFQMRERRGVSQEELGRIWDTSQPNVSKIERQGDLLVSTLRRYIEALGGRLEMQAVFPEERIVLDLGAHEMGQECAHAGTKEMAETTSGSRDAPG